MPHTYQDNAGLGCKLQVKQSTVFVDVNGTSSIEWGDFSIAFRNPNTLAKKTVQKKPTITNLGKFSVTLNYDPMDAVHGALQGYVVTPGAAPQEFKLVLTDGSATTPSSVDFFGWVAEFPISGIEVEGTQEAKMTIEVVDTLTITAGT